MGSALKSVAQTIDLCRLFLNLFRQEIISDEHHQNNSNTKPDLNQPYNIAV